MGVARLQTPQFNEGTFRLSLTLAVALLSHSFAEISFNYAMAQSAEGLGRLEGGIYYDAKEVSLNQKEGSVVLTGDVLFLSGESFLKSDQLSYFPEKGIAIAEGRVTIFHNTERIQATRVVAKVGTQELFAEGVWLSVDPKASNSAKDLNEKILGFTDEEVTFESLRVEREKDLLNELNALRDTYASKKSLLTVSRDPSRTENLKKDIESAKRRYAQILGRLTRTRHQPNLFLEGLSEDEQSRIEKRRETVKNFVRQNSDVAKTIAERQMAPGYIALTAESLSRQKDGKMSAKEARLTPCRCDVDEVALWGLSTSEASVEPAEYATLYGATVDVANIPALYIPYLKFPIKSQRESGFLLPSVYLSRSGQIVSIPYFQTMGSHADATITIDDFSSRGTRTGLEVRGMLSETASATLTGEWLEDKKRPQEYIRESLENDIDQAYPKNSNPYQGAKLKDQIGTINASRWQTTGQVNFPFQSIAAAKANWTFVSDNEYLSDFSVESESKSDLFAPAQSTFRFLPQEIAAEYYASPASLSLRVQRFNDLVSPLADKIPYRAPKAEFSLFPQRLFQTRFHFEQQVTWENIVRGEELSFLDKYTSERLSNGGGPDATEPIRIVSFPDGKRTPNEAFVTGQRFFSQSRISAPLIVNPWIRSSAHVRGVTTAYQFETGEPYNRQRPRMSYVSYEIDNRSIIEFQSSISKNNAGEGAYVSSRQSPFVKLNYVPEVNRDPNFPGYYDVFYEADNFMPQRTLRFGLTGDISWGMRSYQKSLKPLTRFQNRSVPEPADLELLSVSLKDSGLSERNSPQDDPLDLFNASKDLRFSEALESWALAELDSYYEFVTVEEHGAKLQWPEPPFYQLQNKFESTPLIYSIESSYNFDVASTQNDVLNRIREGDTIERIDVWGDVIGSITANARPVLPVTFTTTQNWSPWRKSFYKGVSSVGVAFPFNLNVAVSNSFENYESATTTADQSAATYVKRSIGVNVQLKPRSWLLLTYQRKEEIDSQFARQENPELRYESLQKISLLNLQDCLDLEFSRYKKTAVEERFATWAIGLNLKFLGQSRPISNLGDSLNRSIQDRELNL